MKLSERATVYHWKGVRCQVNFTRMNDGGKTRFAPFVKKVQALTVNAIYYHLLLYNAINMCSGLQCFFIGIRNVGPLFFSV